MIARRNFMLAGAAAPFASGSSQAKTKVQGGASLLVDLDRAPDLEIELWPNGPPGGENVTVTEHYVERENPWNLVDRAAHNVTRPTLQFFRAQEPDGSTILIAPGGGYSWVVVEKEGYEGARYFNRRGANVFVLKYRLPHQGWTAGPDTPLQDAQRAMRLVRARAEKDGADPARISVMGFSAGGHVAGSLATRFAVKVYDTVDDSDAVSARPDAAALIYPVATMTKPFGHAKSRENMIGLNPSSEQVALYSLETKPPQNTPPTFILHATDDDSVPVENALFTYRAFKDAGIKTALHVFDHGGHGFGLRGIDEDPLRAWPDLFWKWSKDVLKSV